MKYNGFKLAKERSRSYPKQTITDAYYADNRALLANWPAKPNTLVWNDLVWNDLVWNEQLERAAAGIGLHVNVDKTEYMCFN